MVVTGFVLKISHLKVRVIVTTAVGKYTLANSIVFFSRVAQW